MGEELDHNVTLVSTTGGFKTEARADEVGTKGNIIIAGNLSFSTFSLICGTFCASKKTHMVRQ